MAKALSLDVERQQHGTAIVGGQLHAQWTAVADRSGRAQSKKTGTCLPKTEPALRRIFSRRNCRWPGSARTLDRTRRTNSRVACLPAVKGPSRTWRFPQDVG